MSRDKNKPRKKRRESKRRKKSQEAAESVGEELGASDAERNRRSAGAEWHFTVASLPSSDQSSGGFFDFKRELEILKAALLYADRVKLCSVGASFMAGLHDFGNLSTDQRVALIQEGLPAVEPDATSGELKFASQLAESVKGSRNKEASAQFSPAEKFRARAVIEQHWKKIEGFVREQFRAVGGESFRQLLDSELVELHPFTHLSARQILRMGMESDFGILQYSNADETYDEYAAKVFSTIQDGKTYPLFDDLTGNIVGEAVCNGLILPSQGDIARGKHGGLSGDLMQRLPLFERADVSTVVEIREELRDHLDDFREAVSEFADLVEPASWDEEFAEEAERIYRERVISAVKRIEQAIEENPYLKELALRFAPGAAVATASSIGTFVGTASALPGLAVLALGLAGAGEYARQTVNDQRRGTEGNRLYFYYRAGQKLRA